MRKPLFGSVFTEPPPPELRWRIAKPEQIIGKQLVLAGKPITLYTHRVGRRTWPCLRSLPMLNIECPHCERSRQPKCWVPVIELKPIPDVVELLVLMGASTLSESVKFIKHGELIHAMKCRALKPTWMVKLDADQSQQGWGLGLLTHHVPERGDITRWLLHYWQWPEITKAFGEVYRESLKRKLAREEAENHKLSLMTGEQAG